MFNLRIELNILYHREYSQFDTMKKIKCISGLDGSLQSCDRRDAYIY